MKNSERKNKTWKIVISSAAVLAFVVAVLTVYVLISNNKVKEENRQYLYDNTVQVGENLDSVLMDGYRNISVLATLLSASLTGPEVDVAGIQELLDNSVFDFMEFADTEGLDHNTTGGTSDASDRQYYLDAKAGNSGMDLIYNSRATHETLLMYYSPVYYNGDFAGSLVGVYQAANRITKLLTVEYYGEPAVSYLCNPEGRIVASNLPIDTEAELDLFDITGDDSGAAAAVKEVLNTGETSVFSLGENKTGACMLQLENSGWYLLQIFPEAASADIAGGNNRLTMSAVAVLILLFIAVFINLVIFENKQYNKVEEANRTKTMFLFNMSHDIRTPMNAILGFSRIAQKHIDDRECVLDSLRKIESAGSGLEMILNDVLEMSRIESGKLTIDEKPCDIQRFDEGITSVISTIAVEKSIDFSVSSGNFENRYVYIDVQHVNRILMNLLTNAVKYTPPGGKVSFRCEQAGPAECLPGGNSSVRTAKYRFTVSDTGIGMSKEFLEHIYEEFSRERTSTVSKQQGTGLGLAIVKRLVDELGGTIEVESAVEKGTVFTVTLPFRLQEKDSSGENYLENKDGSSIGSSAFLLAGKRVLLVEDNEFNREIAADILAGEGLEIDYAFDGRAAVDKVKENGAGEYDLILMDIQMPVMNGYDAARAIRKLPGGEEIPIIALSANAFDEDRKASLEAGMNDHIAKPIEIEKLLLALNRFLI